MVIKWLRNVCISYFPGIFKGIVLPHRRKPRMQDGPHLINIRPTISIQFFNLRDVFRRSTYMLDMNDVSRVGTCIVFYWQEVVYARSKYGSSPIHSQPHPIKGCGKFIRTPNSPYPDGAYACCEHNAMPNSSQRWERRHTNGRTVLFIIQMWGLLNQFPPCRYFPIPSGSWRHTLALEYQVYIWHVSPQLSGSDTCQI